MREYLETFFRRKWLFFLPFLLVLIVALAGGIYLSWQYEVEARLWVNQNPLLDSSGQDLTMTQATAPDEYSQLSAMLQTDDFMGRVVASVPQLAADSDTPAKKDAQIAALRRNLTSWVTEGKLITFHYQSRNAEQTQEVVSNTISLFLAQRLQDRVSGADSAINFLAGEQTRYQAQLATDSGALANWENTHPPATRADLPQTDQLEYQRLKNSYDTTYDHLQYIGGELEKARFSREKAVASHSSTYQIVDAPTLPRDIALSVNRLATIALLGLAVAAGLGFTFVALGTWFGGRKAAAGTTALPDWLDRMMAREEQTA